MEKTRNVFKILRSKTSGKKPLGRPRGRLDNNTMNLKEIGINKRNWVDSAQDRDYLRPLVNAVLNLHKPWMYLVIKLYSLFSKFFLTKMHKNQKGRFYSYRKACPYRC